MKMSYLSSRSWFHVQITFYLLEFFLCFGIYYKGQVRFSFKIMSWLLQIRLIWKVVTHIILSWFEWTISQDDTSSLYTLNVIDICLLTAYTTILFISVTPNGKSWAYFFTNYVVFSKTALSQVSDPRLLITEHSYGSKAITISLLLCTKYMQHLHVWFNKA